MRDSIEIISYFDTAASHSHYHTQIVLPLAGSLFLDVESSQRLVQVGQACLISTEYAHTHLAETDNRCLILNDLACWDSKLNCQDAFINLNANAQAYLPFLASLVKHDVNPQAKEQALRLVEFLLPIPQEVVYKSDHRLEQAIQCIDRGFHEAWTIESLAEQVHLSQSQLTALFKRRLGVTPKQYLLKRRLLQAKKLLADTRLSLEEIALAVGFHDASALSRLFVKQLGVSPGYYRTTCH